MIKIETAHYIRIQRRTAENLFNMGKTIYMVPHRMNPESAGACPAGFQRAREGGRGFGSAVAHFTWYNCNDRQTGLYPAFYIRK